MHFRGEDVYFPSTIEDQNNACVLGCTTDIVTEIGLHVGVRLMQGGVLHKGLYGTCRHGSGGLMSGGPLPLPRHLSFLVYTCRVHIGPDTFKVGVQGLTLAEVI